jgi:pre-mRNA-splicing factor ATP-dependent RNA helicase DHX16
MQADTPNDRLIDKLLLCFECFLIGRAMDLDRLREASRQRYLEKRARQQTERRQTEIADRTVLVGAENLTATQRREIQLDADILAHSQRLNQPTFQLEYELVPASESGATLPERLKSISKAYSQQEERNPFLQCGQSWEKSKIASAGVRPSAHRLFEKPVEVAPTAPTPETDFTSIQQSLPVFRYKRELLDVVNSSPIVLVVGDTGSGKTTQIPQYLLERQSGERQSVVCTQPRRVAAMSVAARVAAERHCPLGLEVGYSVRFEDRTSLEHTTLRYVTDGRLLREFLLDPFLSAYTTIMIDEAHERSISTDILLGLLKDLIIVRPSLRIVIASATLDAEKFSKFFGRVPILYIPGRRFEVSVVWPNVAPPDYCEAALGLVMRIHASTPLEQPCDILVFLTGQEEIEDCVAKVNSLQAAGLEAVPLFSALPSEKQMRIFVPAPRGWRKVICSTNLAETSLTIDTIRYVIDSGFVKQVSYNPRTGCESLDVVPISASSAMQRTGRAGRVAEGVCYRLFTQEAFNHQLPRTKVPELLRCNFTPTLLLLLSIGIETIVDFNFLDPPPSQLVEMAYEQLYSMSAIDYEHRLTELGEQMSKIPLSPSSARAVIKSWELGCQTAVITICSILEARSPLFFIPKEQRKAAETTIKGFWDKEGDHITALNVFHAWEESGSSRQWCIENHVQYRTLAKAKEIRERLFDICGQIGLESDVDEQIQNVSRAFVFGFFTNSAYLANDGLYYTIRNSVQVDIHPSSCLQGPDRPRFCVFYELVMTSKMFMRTAMRIDPNWLVEASPHLFKIVPGLTIRVTM